MTSKQPSRFSTLVLAGGKGTRMKSALPKVLHQACGRSLLAHVLEAATGAGAAKHYVVLGAGREEVAAELARLPFPAVEIWQKEQLGTGHAAQCALPLLAAEDELLVILSGDGPLVRPETIRAFVEHHLAVKAELTLGVMEPADPFGYGRVLLKGGKPQAIVEEKEATNAQRKVRTVNGGIYCVRQSFLRQFLPKLKPSARTGELYLTDLVALGNKARKKLSFCRISCEELAGVNDMLQLAEAEAVLRRRKVEGWMRAGVRVLVPGLVWPDASAEAEAGAVIGPNVSLKGATRLRAGAVVEEGCVLSDSVVEAGAVVHAYSVLEGAVVGPGASVGPFARLRPGAELCEGAKVGNFVEVKKSRLGKGSKASHLSYIGDAEVGEGVNIGCGFIACNYDGVNKHRTVIRDGAFIGSGVQAVAPVTVGEGAYVGTGSTINRDVPPGALAIARPKQENKEGYAERLRGRMLAQKKSKGS